MVQPPQPLGAHVSQGSQFPERTFLGCSPVPLLLHNSVPVFVIVHPIDESHLCQMGGPVSMARLSVQFFSSGDLLRGGWWFGLWRLLFLFCCSTFSFALQNFFFVLHVPLVFPLFCQVWIFVGHTDQNWFLSRGFVYTYRLVCQSQSSVQGWRGWRECGTHGGVHP